jgi:hypothetical protein
MSRTLLAVLQSVAVVVAVGNLCVLAVWVRKQAQEAQKAAGDAVVSNVTTEKENKTVVIKLNARAAESFGVATEPARAGVWRDRVAVFGRVVPNPRATYEVRCPFPGTLLSAGTGWPTPGRTVRPGQPLARVSVRVSPSDRLDLQVRLTEARLKKIGADEVVKLRQNQVDRLTKAGADAVSPRELEEARVQLTEAQTQQKTATESVGIWDAAMKEFDATSGNGNGPWTRILTAPDSAAGAVLEVAEVAAHPGSVVEAGALVVRLVDVTRPLVRLDLPAEALRDGPPSPEVELTLAAPPPSALRGAANRPDAAAPDAAVRAVLVGPVSQADAASQFIGYFYEVRTEEGAPAPRRVWRPGVFVQASLPPADPDGTMAASTATLIGLLAAPSPLPAAAALAPDSPEPNAVVVPAAAVLYHQGRALVYVSREAEKYEHREVQVLGFRDDQCYLAPRPLLAPTTVSLAPGDRVVSSGAQVLLSTEFRRDSDDD